MEINTEWDFFRDRNVLVTGHTGFKGSWLSTWLNQLGANVHGLSLAPREQDQHFRVTNLKSSLSHHEGDIRCRDTVDGIIAESEPEIVFHLAAQSLVRPSYDHPVETFETNVSGSLNILDAVRQSDSVRALVYVTSDKCYKNKEWVWGYRENDELGGRDPYSASKSAAENLFYSYWKSYFQKQSDLGAASVRAGNVLGGGDRATDRIVPDCIRALEEGETIQIRNPQSTRPWQHVLDPLSGYLKVAQQLCDSPDKFSGAWNFGPKSSSFKTVKELTEAIIEFWGTGNYEVTGEDSVHEARFLHLNCDKAQQELDWTPTWDFKRTIKETVKWYRELPDAEEPREITDAQINEFMEDYSDGN